LSLEEAANIQYKKILTERGWNMNQIKLICPKCKADLTLKNAIENIRTGVQKNNLSYNAERHWLDWSEYEFETDGIFEEFNCARCVKEISETIKNFI
jgi:hypothetical protein